MKLLVTGNLGYIGSILVPFLARQGYRVTGLDNDLYRLSGLGSSRIEVPVIFKDIRDINTSDLEGFDAIIHLAALSNDPIGEINQEVTYEINYHATVSLAEKARNAGVKRFLFSSSCSTYGAAGDEILDEEAPFRPVTAYGHSKVLAEQGLLKLADENFCVTLLRNATAYGFSPAMRFDLLLNNLVAWAYTTRKIYIKSDGTPWRPLVHIEDISLAFLCALKAPVSLINKEAFNVGRNQDNFRVKDLAEQVRLLVPGATVEYAGMPSNDTRNYRVNFDKITDILAGFKPVWNIEQGVNELLVAYKRYELKEDEFEGDRFSRILRLKAMINDGQIDASLRPLTV